MTETFIISLLRPDRGRTDCVDRLTGPNPLCLYGKESEKERKENKKKIKRKVRMEEKKVRKEEKNSKKKKR
jgi:hypothetical protein